MCKSLLVQSYPTRIVNAGVLLSANRTCYCFFCEIIQPPSTVAQRSIWQATVKPSGQVNYFFTFCNCTGSCTDVSDVDFMMVLLIGSMLLVNGDRGVIRFVYS